MEKQVYYFIINNSVIKAIEEDVYKASEWAIDYYRTKTLKGKHNDVDLCVNVSRDEAILKYMKACSNAYIYPSLVVDNFNKLDEIETGLITNIN